MKNYNNSKDNTEKNLGDLEFGYDFLDTAPKAQYMKKSITSALLKLRMFSLQKALLR